MTHPEATRLFLLSAIEALEPFDLLLVAPMNQPLHIVEVTRTEAGALEVRLPGRPAFVPQLDAAVRRALVDMGFSSEDAENTLNPWVLEVANAEAAIETLLKVRSDVFNEKPDVKLNVMHGSHRAEHDAEKKLERVRRRVEPILSEVLGQKAEQDEDGDYILAIGEVHITVAPRPLPDGEVVIRVFAITNIGVNVTGELGLFLARLNFGMMFGRFALDTDHRSIWFDETLLGEEFNESELEFVIRMVAATADSWDDRLKQMFGGVTYQEVVAGRSAEKLPTTKPGEGVGMYL